MKQHVFKPSRIKDGKRVKARSYSGRYQLAGDSTLTQVALGVTDKQVAQRKLAEIVRLEERRREGISAPKAQAEAASAPLACTVGDWLRDLAAKGRNSRYIGTQDFMMGLLIRECGWNKLGDINADTFIRWRGLNLEKAPKTLNEYLGCARAFLNWLVRSGRLDFNPLSTIGKVETRGRERRRRRAFTHKEFLALLDAADLPRRIVYAMAYYTGLRRSELASLTWSDLTLTEGKSCVCIRAEHAKNKETVSIPLHPDVRSLLLELCEAENPKSGVDKVLCVPPRLRAFNRDLEQAGIVRLDDQGRVLDFHSLRHSFCTRLAAAGVPLSVAMRAMRHSDPKLTAKIYTDQEQLPLEGAIFSLPGFGQGRGDSLIDSPASDSQGHSVSHTDAKTANEALPESFEDKGLGRELALTGASGREERMVRAAGFEPATPSV